MRRLNARPDFILLLFPILIFSAGIFFIYSASWREGQPLDQSLVIKQGIWMLVAILLTMLSLRAHYRVLLDSAWVLYGITLFLLIIVLFMPARLGAHRWIPLGFFNLQPSEVAKVSVIVALAALMRKFHPRSSSMKNFVLPAIVMAVPVLLIMREPDLGTSLLFFPVLISMMLILGFKLRWLLFAGGGVALLSPILYNGLKDYQKSRILTFLNPDRDPLGAGYTIIQSKIAIGSGGLFGKGFRSGTQTQLHFLPERHTDFIFSVICEEGGFIAGTLILFATWLLIFKGYDIADKCKDRFGKLLAVGITTLLATQALVNMSMTMGLIPVVGMPLFLVSYGGSSIIVSFFLIGVLMNISMRRDPFL